MYIHYYTTLLWRNKNGVELRERHRAPTGIGPLVNDDDDDDMINTCIVTLKH